MQMTQGNAQSNSLPETGEVNMYTVYLLSGTLQPIAQQPEACRGTSICYSFFITCCRDGGETPEGTKVGAGKAE